jgi:hypothetical protein
MSLNRKVCVVAGIDIQSRNLKGRTYLRDRHMRRKLGGKDCDSMYWIHFDTYMFQSQDHLTSLIILLVPGLK